MTRATESLPLALMIERLGIADHPALANVAFQGRLEKVCADCRAAGVCRRMLARGGLTEVPAFCPNAVELAAMRAGLTIAARGAPETPVA